MNKKEISKEIEQFATSLRLPGIKKYFQEDAKDAATRSISYEEYLYGLLQKEYDLKQEHAKENRIRLLIFLLGYISFDKERSELLFTNLSFERWAEIFQDPVMTAAMVDKLTHKAF
ncbi:ATP-binding protein [Thermoanaerobacterium thermosaccharolyticum]|uniref:ATP-binding protein n=1 Tax=Thermoanaerobacterium thermosaccharolyticum TaxID=1517 RepID=UPI003DAA04BF